MTQLYSSRISVVHLQEIRVCGGVVRLFAAQDA